MQFNLKLDLQVLFFRLVLVIIISCTVSGFPRHQNNPSDLNMRSITTTWIDFNRKTLFFSGQAQLRNLTERKGSYTQTDKSTRLQLPITYLHKDRKKCDFELRCSGQVYGSLLSLLSSSSSYRTPSKNHQKTNKTKQNKQTTRHKSNKPTK